jgi:hypothetical protein
MPRILFSLWLGVILLCGCDLAAQNQKYWDDYKATVRSARAVIPIAVQMEELFPVADHFITEYGFDDKPKTWNTEVFFGSRYTLTMQVDVEIDYQVHKILRMVNEPKFYLHESKKIDILPDGRAETTYESDNEKRFGPKEWKKIYEKKAGFSAIGVQLNPTPVENFDENVVQWRRDRIPVSLLDK